MAALRRTAIGPFKVEATMSLEELTPQSISERILPAVKALGDMPRIKLSPQELQRVIQGQSIMNRFGPASEIAALDETGNLVAILVPVDEILRPDKCFRPY